MSILKKVENVFNEEIENRKRILDGKIPQKMDIVINDFYSKLEFIFLNKAKKLARTENSLKGLFFTEKFDEFHFLIKELLSYLPFEELVIFLKKDKRFKDFEIDYQSVDDPNGLRRPTINFTIYFKE